MSKCWKLMDWFRFGLGALLFLALMIIGRAQAMPSCSGALGNGVTSSGIGPDFFLNRTEKDLIVSHVRSYVFNLAPDDEILIWGEILNVVNALPINATAGDLSEIAGKISALGVRVSGDSSWSITSKDLFELVSEKFLGSQSFLTASDLEDFANWNKRWSVSQMAGILGLKNLNMPSEFLTDLAYDVLTITDSTLDDLLGVGAKSNQARFASLVSKGHKLSFNLLSLGWPQQITNSTVLLKKSAFNFKTLYTPTPKKTEIVAWMLVNYINIMKPNMPDHHYAYYANNFTKEVNNAGIHYSIDVDFIKELLLMGANLKASTGQFLLLNALNDLVDQIDPNYPHDAADMKRGIAGGNYFIPEDAIVLPIVLGLRYNVKVLEFIFASRNSGGQNQAGVNSIGGQVGYGGQSSGTASNRTQQSSSVVSSPSQSTTVSVNSVNPSTSGNLTQNPLANQSATSVSSGMPDYLVYENSSGYIGSDRPLSNGANEVKLTEEKLLEILYHLARWSVPDGNTDHTANGGKGAGGIYMWAPILFSTQFDGVTEKSDVVRLMSRVEKIYYLTPYGSITLGSVVKEISDLADPIRGLSPSGRSFVHAVIKLLDSYPTTKSIYYHERESKD